MHIASDEFDAITIEPIATQSRIQRAVASVASLGDALTENIFERTFMIGFGYLVGLAVYGAVSCCDLSYDPAIEGLRAQYLNRSVVMTNTKNQVAHTIRQVRIDDGTPVVQIAYMNQLLWLPVDKLQIVE